MLEEFEHPSMVDGVEETADVRIEHPVHLSRGQAYVQSVQSIVRAAPRPKPIRKAEEVHLVDGVKNRHQGMLDDLVFQGGDAQGPHASIRLGDIGPLGGLGTISPAMNSLMQVVQSAHQSILVVSPGHTVDTRSSLPSQGMEAFS